MNLSEDTRGTYIFNSRDLCMIEHLPEMMAAGISSLKIEGRMKGINYLASVVRIYREAIDAYALDAAAYHVQPEWIAELAKVTPPGILYGVLSGRSGPGVREFRWPDQAPVCYFWQKC